MKSKYCTMYLVRHGQSEANIPDLYGLDTPLTEKGREQSKAIAEEFGNMHLDAIFSSPLLRGRETAEIIAAQHHLSVQILPDLKEKDVGILDGRKTSDVKDQYKKFWDLRRTLPYEQWKTVSLADGWETDEQAMQRFIPCLKTITKEYKGKTVLVTTHLGLMKTLLVHLGIATHQELDGQSIKNTGFIKIKSNGSDLIVEEMKGVENVYVLSIDTK